jgi:hypothetical protein
MTVTSSVCSRSPTAGSPRAMRDTTPTCGASRLARHGAVALAHNPYERRDFVPKPGSPADLPRSLAYSTRDLSRSEPIHGT